MTTEKNNRNSENNCNSEQLQQQKQRSKNNCNDKSNRRVLPTSPLAKYASSFAQDDTFSKPSWLFPTRLLPYAVFTLLDGEFGVVAVAGNDGVFLRFAFLVLHAEGVAFVVDQEDFDVAVAAVVFVVGGAVGEDVLVADGVVDMGEDLRERALEQGGKVETSSH